MKLTAPHSQKVVGHPRAGLPAKRPDSGKARTVPNWDPETQDGLIRWLHLKSTAINRSHYTFLIVYEFMTEDFVLLRIMKELIDNYNIREWIQYGQDENVYRNSLKLKKDSHEFVGSNTTRVKHFISIYSFINLLTNTRITNFS